VSQKTSKFVSGSRPGSSPSTQSAHPSNPSTSTKTNHRQAPPLFIASPRHQPVLIVQKFPNVIGRVTPCALRILAERFKKDTQSPHSIGGSSSASPPVPDSDTSPENIRSPPAIARQFDIRARPSRAPSAMYSW